MANENNQPAVLTGYFTDGIRRIDLVLVLKDDAKENTDKIKIDFLLNAMKLGLQMEVESGKMEKHKRLIFVKIHAPDSVIEEYGETFGIRKYFKDIHMEFINADHKVLKTIKRFLPFLFNNYEREWVKLVRQNYPGPGNYSTLERSQIVYRMFLALPFGNYKNYVGLQSLLEHNIILDAYALHDGPYFILPKQDISLQQVNARQILYNSWIGADAILKSQPVSLLQEYFGEKVAFYFAFCEYMNRGLIMVAAVGAVQLYSAHEETRSRNAVFIRRGLEVFYCTDSKQYLIPRCRDFDTCPFYAASTACDENRLKFTLECSIMRIFHVFTIFSAVILVLLWKRREVYLSWFWELNDKSSNIYRTNYRVNFKGIKRSKVTGLLQSHQSIWAILLIVIKNLILLATMLAIVFPMTLMWANYYFTISKKVQDKYDNKNRAHFYGIAFFSAIYVAVNIVLEKVTCILAYISVNFENHKTQGSYERSLIVKQCGMMFAFTFSYFLFLTFIKGRIFTYPSDVDNWKMIGGIGMMNCGLFSCLDEVFVLLAVSIVLRYIVLEGVFALLRFNTDYNQNPVINATIPCWEREYRLNNIGEQFIINIFKDQAMLFALATLFSGGFPLAPACVLISNVLITRYNAWLLLLGSRRPLLHNAIGVAIWGNIIGGVAFASAFTNILMSSINNRASKADFYEYWAITYNSDWLKIFATDIVPTTVYNEKKGPGSPGEAFNKYKGYVPSNAYFSGQWIFYKKKWVYSNYYATCVELGGKSLLGFQFMVIMGLIAVLIIFPKEPQDVKETAAIENRIKEQCFIRQRQSH